MNKTVLNTLSCLVLIMVCAFNARAGLLEEACSAVYNKLGSGPYESLIKSTEDFTDNGNHYNGCVIRLSANANKIRDTQRPAGIFGRSLPYCPDGKLSLDVPRDFLNKDGWCGDKMADGPDGTYYRAIKQNIFCLVEGLWDGGDDSDPKYVRWQRYEVTVKCSSATGPEHR